MKFQPQEIPLGSPPFFEDAANRTWTPLYSHGCTFGPDIFAEKMMNLIKNPNLNSSWLFRADILYDEAAKTGNGEGGGAGAGAHVVTSQASGHPHRDDAEVSPIAVEIRGMTLERTLVRRLIPRNERRDTPLEQTCAFYTTARHDSNSAASLLSTLVIYMPHSPSADGLPFYHPKVRGIAHLHQWEDQASASSAGRGTISVHFLPYPEHPLTDARLQRTAYHLLEILDKHGHGAAEGYVKRVNHDVVIPQDRFQNRYALLKSKYARQLVDSWAEKTDPSKHVFEDLGIAAFLMELWGDMYPKDGGVAFPGFVDIGCGNGLLVYLLTQEGYSGWGFDARERKSWAQYRTRGQPSPSGSSLEERLLLPAMVSGGRGQANTDCSADANTNANANATASVSAELCDGDSVVHDGVFAAGTFIISNHADELTPWTPILAASSGCPFIMIPCCSHNLTGDKFRAPPPRDRSKAKSTYASLVDWVSRIADDCGWEVETEMLRIPSTRNTCLLGRKRTRDVGEAEVEALVDKYGGTGGYYENVAKLVKSGPRGH
ncbi:trna uracil-o2--methyltransferase [Trichoderma arundinaceum]|uniref:tRNA (uracil-O(2)-)-methyltransferase n=1 Tax=Trichoderma arundinaceum TaxID=490622 RepID=A0A395N7Y8_TRIAR|nr:trna uracil-o2--methyltransferase [Trichoderma arundinaceum]